jgi:transposase
MTREEIAERTAAMVALKREGRTYQEIAEEFGISRQGVYLHVRPHMRTGTRGSRGQKSMYTPKQWAFVRQLRNEGYPTKDLATWLQVSGETVRRNTRTIAPARLPPLDSRKAEFYRLAGDTDGKT